MVINMLISGDIHFGYYPPDLLYKEFKQIVDYVYENKVDVVVIAGDYFDNKLVMSSAHSIHAIKAFTDLVTACEVRNTKLRVIRGTHSHDPENQLKVLSTIAQGTKCDFRLFTSVDKEELFPGFKVLYIPEEYMEDKNEYYKEYFGDTYDAIFGHGMFEETTYSKHSNANTMKKYPVFNSKFMENICRGIIAFGHIHKHQRIRDRILYTGSLTRSRHGEEEEKGFIVATYDTDTHKTTDEFIVNDMAMKYDTIEITEKSPIFSMLVKDQIQFIKDKITQYKRDKLRIKISIPEDYATTRTFVDTVNSVFNGVKDVQFDITENNKAKIEKETNEQLNRLMTKYGFIFDKSITYEDKIHQFIKAKKGVDIPIENIRRLIYGN